MRYQRLGTFCALILILLSTLTSCQTSSLSQQTQPSEQAATPVVKVNVNEIDRPSQNLIDAVERYISKYQPGQQPRLFQNTYIYDRNGVELAELWDEGKRTWATLDNIASTLISATISTEDDSFFTNFGVDPFRLAAALFRNAKEGDITSGASTITMQLARNLFLGPEQRYNQSIDRKLLEIGLAQEINALYTKREILEMYLNLLNYGNLNYGPEAAARGYFGKSAKELNMAEATLLAGIPQFPVEYDPYKKFDKVKARQRVVLDLMVQHGDLTKREADRVYQEPITITAPITTAATILAPHFVQYVELALDKRFGEAGYTRRTGYHIYTTLDLHTQALAQKIINQKIANFRYQYNLGNSALIAMRPNSGEIVALVGSADFYDDSIDGQVNVVIHRRQPGSTLKPILYALGMNDHLISPATVMWDTPVNFDQGNGAYYSPRNYDMLYHGLVTVRTALANSYNVPVVKLLDQMGIERALKGFEQFGIRSIRRDSYHGLGMALGANEATLAELTNAYLVLASGGLYVQPEVVLKVLDSQGQPKPIPQRPDPVQVISPATAFQVTDIMSDNRARAPMFGLNSPLKLSKPAAVKTGTTSDFRDNWTIGFTRYLVTGIWSGNSNGQPMRDSTGVTGAAPIWNTFMEAVLADKEILKLLGAPIEKTGDETGNSNGNDEEEVSDAWRFIPPPDVELRPDCPLDLDCREGGEYFSKAWLAAAGEAGPLADSFLRRPSLSVYTGMPYDHWTPLYCEDATGQARTMLNLTGKMGLPGASSLSRNETVLAQQAELAALTDASQATTLTLQSAVGEAKLPLVDPKQAEHAITILYYPEKTIERYSALAWTAYQNNPIDIGPCQDLAYYYVQPGDYWGEIANRFGLRSSTMQLVNNAFSRAEGVLIPGDRLLVPKGISVQIGFNGRQYIVQDGDTWSDIATAVNVPLKLLMAVNPSIVRPYLTLQPGDEVWIPDPSQVAQVMEQEP